MELKPCPFCGGDAVFERKGTARVSNIISCENCICVLETNETGVWCGSAWNTRPIEEELRSTLKICLRQLQRAINGDTLDGDWIQAELQARTLLE